MNKATIQEIKEFATQIRIETVKSIAARGFGHLSGSLSVTDALAVLYKKYMNVDPKNPEWADRDKLVMSKGHAGPALYSVLALKGYFPMEWLATLNQPDTRLPSHADRLLTPGIDMTTGSLGQGVSTSIGLALAQKLDGKTSHTYLFVGDGELNEGQVWEGALFAPHHKLNNLTMFVDRNHKQLDGGTCDILDIGDAEAKFKAFGWNTLTIDGHDVEELIRAIDIAHAYTEGPTCIVMETLKGKGVTFVEEMEINHHITVSVEQAEGALKELEAHMEAVKRGDA